MRKWLLWSLSFCILDADCLTTRATPSSHRFSNARNLIVVLPVIHGYDNISQEKLQYLYTKPPVTVLVEDATDSPSAAAALRARPNVVSEQNPTRPFETMRKPSPKRPVPPPPPPPSVDHLEPIDSDSLDFIDTKVPYEYPISSNSYELIASTSRTPSVEYPKSTADSNWKAVYVNYTDSSLADSIEDTLADEFTNSTEATDKIISILAQLGYLSGMETSGDSEADGDVPSKNAESNYLTSFRTFGTNGDKKKPSSANNLLQSLGLLRQKRSADALAKRRRKSREDTEASTTTESTRSRVLRYMMANPRIKSVHELFQVIRNTMNQQSSATPQRRGKSSKDDVLATRQDFDRADTSSMNTTDTVVTAASEASENSTRATSLNDVDAPSPSEVASSTPPNGVYFYVDWNSFLNMTPSSGDPISVNFSPKAGNRGFFTQIDNFNRLAGAA